METETGRISRRETLALQVLLGIAVLVGGLFLYVFLTRPPQMGTSEEVFKTVDALYTAVRSKDLQRLGECELRLTGYKEAGKLPASAAVALGGIIQQARSGAWQRATENLHSFMLAQRREGEIEQSRPEKARKATGARGKSRS